MPSKPARKGTLRKVAGKIVARRRERDIQTAILALLRAHGVGAWKVGGGAFRVPDAKTDRDRFVKMGQTGMADIIGVLPDLAGRFVAIECKTHDGQLTPEQAAFLTLVRSKGGLAFVARSVDDVARELGWA